MNQCQKVTTPFRYLKELDWRQDGSLPPIYLPLRALDSSIIAADAVGATKQYGSIAVIHGYTRQDAGISLHSC